MKSCGKANLFGLTVTALLLSGCGDPVGSACATTGSGFTASHNCATKCLSRWSLSCTDGRNVLPNVCAGKKDCEPGSCPSGQLCYHFDDPFEDRSYCVPDTVCGDALTGEEARAWELAAQATAAASREVMNERKRRREQAIKNGQPAVSAPALDTDNTGD